MILNTTLYGGMLSNMFKRFTGMILVVTLIFSGCGISKDTSQGSKVMHIYTSENDKILSKKLPTSSVTKPTMAITTSTEELSENTGTQVKEKIVTSAVSETPQGSEVLKSDDKTIADEIYNDFYIGEAFKSGFIYIEPFKIQRTSYYDGIKINDYPNIIEFYTIEKENVYNPVFYSESNIYIPSVEEESKYYWQGSFVEPEQSTLRYISSTQIKETLVGVTFFNHEVSDIDFSNSGKNRNYSKTEYSKALEEVKKGIEDKKNLEGTLREITIDDTIVGAKQICIISIKGTNLKMILSKYLFIGFESTADVYVIDLINPEGKTIKTFEKYNCAAY